MNKKYDWLKIISPLDIAKNTIVRKTMTEREFKIANDVSNNWIKWIKKNMKNYGK